MVVVPLGTVGAQSGWAVAPLGLGVEVVASELRLA